MTETADSTTKDETTTTTTSVNTSIVDVTIHPLVLLSAADHYHRVARGTKKRVVGVLLGSVSRGNIDATNSFAVPLRKIPITLLSFTWITIIWRTCSSCSERSMPKSVPVFCIIDIRPNRQSIPTTAYKVVEEVSSGNDSNQRNRQFAHVPSLIGAMEAEEVGVEHLLREINDPTVSTVASLIKAKMSGLATLAEKLVECQQYLEACVRGEKKMNPEISANMQTILNLLPNLNTEDLVRSMLVKTNDMHMAIYLSALIRSVIALHDLVNNKIQYGHEETGEEKKEDPAPGKTKEVAKESSSEKTKETEKK
ncbi:JAB/MPN domain [Fragilaria crotonensis]|nr:JAB/MPN domain [Fragilaria crotonensis]